MPSVSTESSSNISQAIIDSNRIDSPEQVETQVNISKRSLSDVVFDGETVVNQLKYLSTHLAQLYTDYPEINTFTQKIQRIETAYPSGPADEDVNAAVLLASRSVKTSIVESAAPDIKNMCNLLQRLDKLSPVIDDTTTSLQRLDVDDYMNRLSVYEAELKKMVQQAQSIHHQIEHTAETYSQRIEQANIELVGWNNALDTWEGSLEKKDKSSGIK